MPKPWIAALLAVALVTPAHAAPAPQVTDPKGDWAVASQDVLSARVSSVLVNRVPTLRAELTLAAAPESRLPTDFVVQFFVGCTVYDLNYDGTTAALERLTCAATPVSSTAPATVTVRGTTLVLQAPYALGLRRGQVATYFAAAAYTVYAGVYQPGLSGDLLACTCDVAFAPDKTSYVLGSDLPRR